MANKISVIIEATVDGANRSLKSFRQSIDDADGAAGKFRAGIGSAFDAVKANAGNLALAAAAMAVTFSVKAVGAFQETALAAGKMSDALGLTTEEASRYIEVAGDIGVSTESITNSIGRMNLAASKTPGAFQAIGAEMVKNADGTTNVNETFLSTVDALNRIPDATKRAEAAQKIFGKGWKDMAELIGLGADGIRKSLASVEGGKVIDDKEVERAKKFRDSLDVLKGTVEELTVEFGGALVPALAATADGVMVVVNAVKSLNDIGNARIPILSNPESDEYAKQWKQNLQDLAAGAKEGQAGTLELTTALSANAIETVKAAAANIALEASTKGATDSAIAHRNALRDELAARNEANAAKIAAVNSSLGYRNQVAATTQTIRESSMIQADAKRTDEERAQAARDAEGAVLAQAAALVQFSTDAAEARGQTLTNNEQTRLYKEELQRLADGLNGPARDAILAHIAALESIPKSIETRVTATVPRVIADGIISGGQGGVIRVGATGGIVTKPTMALIGEAGPEAVVPLSGAPGASPLPGGMGGGNTYNFTINDATDPDRVVQAIRQFVRRNGPVQGIT